MIRFFRLPLFFRLLYPQALFRLEESGRKIYLTFDDGPDNHVTPVILDTLRRHNIKATFFCTGAAVEANRSLFDTITTEGHLVANHGYHHLKGWRTPMTAYIANADKASELIDSRLYRPPFGSITPRQYRILKEKFRIIFWDLIVFDFDVSFGSARVLKTLKERIRSGSVVVLHDTSKSCAVSVLDETIGYLKSKGFEFALIPDA
jgi:peptidoglycan-N-acetylglucosamine deacetylase